MIISFLRKIRNILTMDVDIFSVRRIVSELEGAPFRLKYLEGKGSYTVFAALDMSGNGKYIIKISNRYRGGITKKVIETKRQQYIYLSSKDKFSREENILRIMSNHGLAPKPVFFSENYSAEEFVRGEKISDLLKSDRKDASDILATSLRAISKMHLLGVVHGDLRPYNILLDGSCARFIDFEHSLNPQRFSVNQMRAFDFLIFLNELERINPALMLHNRYIIKEEIIRNIPDSFTKHDVVKVMEGFGYAEHFSGYFF